MGRKVDGEKTPVVFLDGIENPFPADGEVADSTHRMARALA
jgi:hypothetical protein